jgi:hypothetical protein
MVVWKLEYEIILLPWCRKRANRGHQSHLHDFTNFSDGASGGHHRAPSVARPSAFASKINPRRRSLPDAQIERELVDVPEHSVRRGVLQLARLARSL